MCVPPIGLFDGKKYKGFCAANLSSPCLPVAMTAEAGLVSHLSITWGPKFGAGIRRGAPRAGAVRQPIQPRGLAEEEAESGSSLAVLNAGMRRPRSADAV